MTIRICRDDERDEIFAVINAAAEAYCGVIPADRWHEPYMSRDALDRELTAGVVFWGYDDGAHLAGSMGLQQVRDVELIRHAYVLPGKQRHGIGSALLRHLQQMSTKRMLVGTWVAATWAIRFYERHGFALVSPQRKTELLKSYWTIPDRQIEPRSCSPIRRRRTDISSKRRASKEEHLGRILRGVAGAATLDESR
jgi:GNAT superfamily N-acetyltransferase